MEYYDYVKKVHTTGECRACSAVERIEIDTQKVMATYDELLAAGTVREAGEFISKMAIFADECGELFSAASFLNELAGFWRVHGNKEKSYASCEKALEIMRSAGMDSTIDYATMLLNYATAKTAFGEIEAALKIYAMVDDIYADKLEANDYRRASLLNNIAQAYMKTGKLPDALRSFEASYKMLEADKDTDVEKATCLTNMAFCLIALRDIERAVKKIEAAEKIYASLGDEPHYDSFLSCKGQINYVTGKYAEAADCFARSAANTERRFGRTPNYFMLCKNAAKAFAAAGMHEKASVYTALADKR